MSHRLGYRKISPKNLLSFHGHLVTQVYLILLLSLCLNWSDEINPTVQWDPTTNHTFFIEKQNAQKKAQ